MYDGADTVEIHRHFDADGNQTGSTEVVIPSPWDEDSRDEAEALHEADLLICPHCGNLREDCSQPDGGWYPQRNICYASGALEVAQWRYHEKHKKAERSQKSPTLPTDGVTLWVSRHDLTPGDDFI